MPEPSMLTTWSGLPVEWREWLVENYRQAAGRANEVPPWLQPYHDALRRFIRDVETPLIRGAGGLAVGVAPMTMGMPPGPIPAALRQRDQPPERAPRIAR